MATCQQLLLEIEEIFNDSVVHHCDATAAVGVRMGVSMGRPAVGGPSGMAQTHGAWNLVFVAVGGQAVDLAHRLAKLQLPGMVYDGDTGTIIASVLQPLKTFKDYRPGFLVAYVSYDPTHGPPPIDLFELKSAPCVRTTPISSTF